MLEGRLNGARGQWAQGHLTTARTYRDVDDAFQNELELGCVNDGFVCVAGVDLDLCVSPCSKLNVFHARNSIGWFCPCSLFLVTNRSISLTDGAGVATALSLARVLRFEFRRLSLLSILGHACGSSLPAPRAQGSSCPHDVTSVLLPHRGTIEQFCLIGGTQVSPVRCMLTIGVVSVCLCAGRVPESDFSGDDDPEPEQVLRRTQTLIRKALM